MRFRAVHFACVMVLLSTFGAADSHALTGRAHRAGQPVRILLQHRSAAASAPATLPSSLASRLVVPQPASPASTQTAWTMRPPVAHTLAQHAVTGSGL